MVSSILWDSGLCKILMDEMSNGIAHVNSFQAYWFYIFRVCLIVSVCNVGG